MIDTCALLLCCAALVSSHEDILGENEFNSTYEYARDLLYDRNESKFQFTENKSHSMLVVKRKSQCGVRKKWKPVKGSKRLQRYTLHKRRWKKYELTYKITRYPEKRTLSPEAVSDAVSQAFATWTVHTDLVVRAAKGDTDLEITFLPQKEGGFQNGTIFGYSSFPPMGHVVMNADYSWSIGNKSAGADLFKGLLHEVGHSLGLSHSMQNDSIMRSHIRLNYDPHFQLHDEDINVIQALYGKRIKKPPDLCSNASFDAIFDLGGVVYVLKGRYYWQLAPDGLVSDYPRNISDQWPGLPGDIDAATATDTGVIYFFKGKKFWIYDRASQHTYNYSYIRRWWPGIPDTLHGVTWISSHFYFFKDNKYWKYDPSQKHKNARYPRPLSDWGNMKGKLNDVLHSGSEHVYFFTDGLYYRSTYNTCLIGPNYPRPTDLYWFGCQANSECVNSPLTANYHKGYGKSRAHTSVRITSLFPKIHIALMVVITVYEQT